MKTIELDIFGRGGEFVGKKRFCPTLDNRKSLNQWWVTFKDSANEILGLISNYPSDFQNQQKVCLLSKPLARYCLNITRFNLIPFAIYFAVRQAIPATWLNDCDQFLYPNNKWQKDIEFHNNCLAFTLFYKKNRITTKEGVNHFIPFSESEVSAKEAFASNFMHRFMSGKIKSDSNAQSLNQKNRQKGFEQKDFYTEVKSFIPTKPLSFSDEAKAVFAAGLSLWKYYHSQNFSDSKNPYNINASLYDIKAHFQGFNDKGKMNPPQKAEDSHYKDLIGNLNYELQNLAKKIEPKIYEYGFLLE